MISWNQGVHQNFHPGKHIAAQVYLQCLISPETFISLGTSFVGYPYCKQSIFSSENSCRILAIPEYAVNDKYFAVIILLASEGILSIGQKNVATKSGNWAEDCK